MSQTAKKNCSLFKKTHNWKLLGDKAYLNAHERCSECTEEPCLKDTFRLQNPSKNYSDYEIFVNNVKPKAKQAPDQQEDEEVEEPEEAEEIEEPVE
jgi:hypothetical protein